MGIALSERGANSGLHNRSEELPFGIPFFERGMPKYTYDSGQRIFGLGDSCDSLAVLTEGKVDLVRQSIWGRSIIITSLQAPALFAEGVFLDRYPWDVWSMTPTVVVKIDMDVLPDVFRETPHLRRLVAETFADYVRVLAGLTELFTYPVRVRVIRRLLAMAIKQEDGAYVVENVSTQEQLAREIRSSRESVNKELRKLEDEGAIEKIGTTWSSGIRIPSIERWRAAFGIESGGGAVNSDTNTGSK